MRFRLRTLLILLAIVPAAIATIWFAVLTWFEFNQAVHDGIRVQYKGMEDDGNRIQKGLPRFTKD